MSYRLNYIVVVLNVVECCSQCCGMLWHVVRCCEMLWNVVECCNRCYNILQQLETSVVHSVSLTKYCEEASGEQNAHNTHRRGSRIRAPYPRVKLGHLSLQSPLSICRPAGRPAKMAVAKCCKCCEMLWDVVRCCDVLWDVVTCCEML
jgi:hypothetical protein